MNKVYKSVWNATAGTYVAAAETTKGSRKKSGRKALNLAVIAGGAVAALAGSNAAMANDPDWGNWVEQLGITDSGGQIGFTTWVPGLSGLDFTQGAPVPVPFTGYWGTVTNASTGEETPVCATMGNGAGSTVSYWDCSGLLDMGSGGGKYAKYFVANSTGAVPVATGTDAMAMGQASVAAGNDAVALGTSSTATGTNSVAIGYLATAVNDNSIAIGTNSVALANNSVALGTNSIADRANTVSVGSVGNERQIVNVAAGTQDTDAVNLAQLKAMGAIIDTSGNITASFVAYDNSAKTNVTLGGATATSAVGLTNVAAGQVSSTSKDAINGSQLYNTASSVATALGGGSSVGADGKVSKPAYALSGTTYNDVGAALAAVDAKAGSGSTNGVQYDTSAHTKVTLGGTSSTTPVTLANVAAGVANTDAVNMKQLKDMGASIDTSGNVTGAFVAYDNTNKDTVTLKGASGTKITGLSAGAVSASSSDAVNGSQLYGTANSIAGALGGGAAVDATGKVKNPSYTVAGTTYNNVGSAIDAVGTAIDGINTDVATTTKYIKVVSGSAAAIASGGEAVAIGGGAFASGTNSVSIGSGSRSQFSDAVALGSNSVATVANTVSVGSKGSERRIMNVAAGTTATDAVNFSQLTALQTQTNALQQQISQQSGGVRSMLLGANTAVPVTNYIAVSSSVTAGTNTDTDNSLNAMAIGPTAHAGGENSLAVGAGAATSLAGSTAVGSGAGALALNATVIGAGATTSNNASNAVAIGYNANAQGVDAMAFGSSSQVNGAESLAVGANSFVSTGASNSVALGANTMVNPNITGAVALGANSIADRANTVSVGSGTQKRQIAYVAAGTAATDAVNVTQLSGLASVIGGGAGVNSDGTIKAPTFTIGGKTYTDVGSALAAAGTGTGGDSVNYDSTSHTKVTLGGSSSTTPVTLANVADGKANNDAVNVAQLKAMGASFDTSGVVTNAFVSYDDSTKAAITLKGASGTKISGLAAGTLSAASTDAVNGAQLFGTNSNVTNLTNVVNNITTGGAGVKYFHANGAGADSVVTGDGSIAIGAAAAANTASAGAGNIAIGQNASASTGGGGYGATALGANASAGSSGNSGATAIGAFSKALYNSTALGSGASSTGLNTALGNSATATGAGAVALGNGAVADRGNTVSVGNSTVQRQIVNVAAGTQDMDAVNLAQLKAMGAAIDTSGNITGAFVAYDNSAKSKVTFGGAGSTTPVTLANVAAGVANTDAVNMKQLKDLGASFDTSGNITGAFVAYDNSAKSKVTLGGAGSTTPVTLANVAAGVANTDAVNMKQLKDLGASFDTSGNITGAFVAYDNSTKSKVTLGGAGSTTPVTLANVADGKANNDAVNVAQLKAMGASIDTSGVITNSFVSYDDSTKGTITLKGASGTKISGLTAGTLSATSTDAVNGAQLFATNSNVTNLTNTVNNITNGGGVKYFHVKSTGADATVTGSEAIGAGSSASASGSSAVAIGFSANATQANSVALGANSLADRANAVSVGKTGSERQIINVAAGTANTDAVNLKQLKDLGASFDTSGNVTGGFVAYDNSAKTKVTLGGAGSTTPVTLANVAAGAVTSSSSDAVNGSQLYGVANSVAGALGGGSSVSPNGTVTKPTYALSAGTYTDVGAALAGIDGAVSSINNNITETTKYIKVVSASAAAIASGGEAVAIGGGAFASGQNSLAIGSGARAQFADSMALGSNSVVSAANTISVGSRNAERRIMNVAAGTAATDAVNLSQLTALQNATTDQVTALQQQLAQQSGGVRSMLQANKLLGDSLPVTSYIAVSSDLTPALPGAQVLSGKDAMAIGPGAVAMGDNSLVIGKGSGSFLDNTTVIGSGAVSSSMNTTIIGAGASTNNKANNAVAIGYLANAQGADTLSLGSGTQADGAGAVSLGNKAYAIADNSMALGASSTSSAVNSVALGMNSEADRANTISVGNSTAQRQIVNVAAGTENTDAVNLGQMNAAIAAVAGGGSADAVVYDTSTHDKLTLGGASAGLPPVTLTNVAAGQVTSTSKDAINGAQLYGTAASVAAALGGNSAVGADGKVSKPAYTLNGNTYDDVGAALVAVNDKAGSGGSANSVVYDSDTHDKVTLGGSGTTTPVLLSNVADGKANNDAVNVAQLKAMGASFDTSGNITGAFVAYDDASKGKVTFGGIGATAPVVLSNVGAGQITSSSKDAINGSQLYNTATSVAEALGGGSTAGSDGKVSKPAYSLDGKTYSDVGTALDGLNAKIATGSTDGVVYDSSRHDKLTLGGANATTQVQLSNVADAKLDNDAVNLKQLKEAGLNVDTSGNVTNAFVAYDNATKGSVTFNMGGSPTQLKNVANATDTFDAVNYGQMQAYVADHAGTGTANGVAYDDSTKTRVTLGGAGSTTPVTLTNVAAGSDATDAVNYSQFSALESKVNNIAGGGGTNSTYISINPAADAVAASATGTDAIAIGNGAVASGAAAIAIGKNAASAGDNAVSLGVSSAAQGAGSVALGYNASAPNVNSVALGSYSTTDRDNSVSVGSAGAERQITNVAAGTQGTDAVNLNQLNNAMGGVQQQMHDIDRNAAKGIAAASALNIVTPYLPGRTTLNAGVANYRGQQAVGLGVSRWNEKGTINYNLGVSSSGGNSTIVRAGIGIVLGN